MRRFYLPACCLMMCSEQQRTKDSIKKPMKSLKKESAEDKTMNVKNRILLIRLSEKLSKNPAYSQQLGLSAQLRKSRIKAKPLYSDCGGKDYRKNDQVRLPGKSDGKSER